MVSKEFKIKQTSVDQELPKGADPVVKEEVNFTRFMVGTYLDPRTGEWMVAQAPFDPLTLTIGDLVPERVAGNAEVMREKLAIKQVNLGLLEPGAFKEEKKNEIY